MSQGGSRKNIARAQQPLVSIIIATYNAAQHLPGCLDSIIAQTYPAIEVVVVDGESTDGTVDILRQYDAHISHWISEPDNGIYDALNKGTKLATGKWVYFLGADDRLLPGFSIIAARLEDENSIYYGNTKADGPLFTGEFTEYRLAKYCINHQSVFYPAKVFTKYQYDTQYRIYADYALNIACWGDSTIKKQYVDINVAWYNLTGFSALAQDDAFKRDKPAIIKKHMGLLMYLRFLYKRRKEQSRPDSNFY